HQLVFQVGDFTVQGDGLDGAVSLEHDGAAGGFVAAAGLHAHVAVLHDIQATDAVLAANLVQVSQHFGRAHLLAINGDDVALAVGQLDVGWSVRRGFRRLGPAPHVLFVLGPGVFQHATFIGDMQQVGIHGVRRFLLAVALDRDLVLGGIVHQLLARQQVPFAPGSDDFDARLERIGAQFETHLVVTLAGGAVGNGVSAGFVGDFDQTLGDQRTGNRSAQQVFAFVDGVGAEHRIDEITHELFAQVVDVDFLDTHGLSLGAGRLDLLALTEGSGEGHHVTVVGVVQPLENRRGIQATGRGQNHLLNVRHAISSTGSTGTPVILLLATVVLQGHGLVWPWISPQEDESTRSTAAVVLAGSRYRLKPTRRFLARLAASRFGTTG